MKSATNLLTTLVATILTLTACQSYDPDEPLDSMRQLIDVIHSETEIECEIPPAEEIGPDPNSVVDWEGTQCSDESVLYFAHTEDAIAGILNTHAEEGIAKSLMATGDNWIYRGTSEQATEVRTALEGSQPNLSQYLDVDPTPIPTPTLDAVGVEITCTNEDSEVTGEGFTTDEEVWDELSVEERGSCRAEWAHEDQGKAVELHDYTDTESEALDVANLENEALPDLYASCAATELGKSEHASSIRDDAVYISSDQDRAEVDGAFVLCPDHPERETVEQGMAEAADSAEQHEQGERFRGGAHRVAEDIEPGTYVVEEDEGFDGCYWERLDSAGNIIDNNFIGEGFRAEVTIQPSDYSFSSSGCGEWVKQ